MLYVYVSSLKYRREPDAQEKSRLCSRRRRNLAICLGAGRSEGIIAQLRWQGTSVD
jgi:hypothetical protein